MTCTCTKDNEARLAEHYTKELGTPAAAKATNLAIVFGESVSSRPFAMYRIKADKPGWRSAKGKETNLLFTYCPFCGVKIDEPPVAPK